MALTAELLRTHIQFTQWANGRLVAAAGALTHGELTRDFGTADKSVLGTLVHLFAAERAWLGRLLGTPPAKFVTEEDYRLDVLQSDWPVLGQHWKEWSNGLTDAAAAGILSYSDLRGNRWEQPVWQIVLHVVTPRIIAGRFPGSCALSATRLRRST